MNNPSTESQEIKIIINSLLEKYNLGGKLTLAMIEDWIYHDNNLPPRQALAEYQNKIFAYFPGLEKTEELEEILAIISKAWNCLPHRSLDGLSPNDLIHQETGQIQTETKPQEPIITVGDHNLSWQEYEELIKQMELRQKPLKDLIAKLLPKYKAHLLSNPDQENTKTFYEISEIFLDRILHLGLTSLNQVPQSFLNEEFPEWCQKNIINSPFRQKEIEPALKRLYRFIETEKFI